MRAPRDLHLRSRKKCHVDNSAVISTRVKHATETLHTVMPLCKRIGVTRISNITYLDHLLIPNYSSVLPSTEDTIWVYGGKGVTKEDAKVSAVMEAIERYTSLGKAHQRSTLRGRYSELVKSYTRVLHPAEVVEAVIEDFTEDHSIIDYLPGVDLLSHDEVLVPAEIAMYRYLPKKPANRIFLSSHTNGLAAGNVYEEAVSQALCEVIERDAVSIADLCASSIPYTILANLRGLTEKSRHSCNTVSLESKFIDDSSMFQEVDLSEIIREIDPVARLVKRFTNARIPLMVKEITRKEISIPTFVASSIEWMSYDYGYCARGYGAHPDAKVALMRAITELSQTRAINIQGARDDLKKIRYRQDDYVSNRKWEFMHSSLLSAGKHPIKNEAIKFGEVQSHSNTDILQDICLILKNLKSAALKKVIIVNLTDPSLNVPVVRAIVPGLETFEVTKSVMGRRARESFRNLCS